MGAPRDGGYRRPAVAQRRRFDVSDTSALWDLLADWHLLGRAAILARRLCLHAYRLHRAGRPEFSACPGDHVFRLRPVRPEHRRVVFGGVSARTLVVGQDTGPDASPAASGHNP